MSSKLSWVDSAVKHPKGRAAAMTLQLNAETRHMWDRGQSAAEKFVALHEGESRGGTREMLTRSRTILRTLPKYVGILTKIDRILHLLRVDLLPSRYDNNQFQVPPDQLALIEKMKKIEGSIRCSVEEEAAHAGVDKVRSVSSEDSILIQQVCFVNLYLYSCIAAL